MEKNPKISVIVPVYKTEQYLPQCIESILAQTFTDFELLLIVDGSPDCCGEICDRYAAVDKRIRVFHQENAGVSAARNTGLREAKGEYVTFVDSDDWIMPDYLLRLYGALSENSTGLVIAGALKCWGKDKNTEKIELPNVHIENNLGHFFIKYELYRYGFICSKLYDGELIRRKNLHFDVDIPCLEDLFFMMDYLLYSDYITMCSATDYRYRVSCSTDTLSSKINDFNREYCIFSSFRERNNIYKDKYAFSDYEVHKLDVALKIPFHKLLLSLYSHNNHYSYSERMKFLHTLLSKDKRWIKKHFFPDYQVDRIAKYLLCNFGKESFDIWMKFLYKVRFKRMFGGNNI